MTEEEMHAQILVLQKQQAYQTNAIRAALEGRWSGPDSVDAWVKALNPEIKTAPQTPLYTD
jgi:hypothetical protein